MTSISAFLRRNHSPEEEKRREKDDEVPSDVLKFLDCSLVKVALSCPEFCAAHTESLCACVSIKDYLI